MHSEYSLAIRYTESNCCKMEAAAVDIPKENAENVVPHSSNDGNTPSPPPQDSTKKLKKEDSNKKDDKNVDQFLKSLNVVPSVEEKLSLMCNKYLQLADNNKKSLFYNKQSDRRHALIMKEKEHLQQEFNKTILLKSKLENLCRELQKQNKAIKDESMLKIREEEERRKETQAKFQNTLTEITALLQQNHDKNAKLRDDNISMSEKFKSIMQQYQLREQQVDKMAKQMTLESQLSDAKLQKANLEHQAEKERLIADMEDMKVTVAQYRAKIIELQGVETSLKGQLAVYTDKYDEFQNALVKSNQVFSGFKEQMEMMSKKIKKLEKESLTWKKRWETSQTALLDMCADRQSIEEQSVASGRQLQHMQSLCRTLQAERTTLLTALKENNIERPPLPAPTPAPPAPAPVPAPASNSKVDAMVANCAQLRHSLAHLQSQLNVLTTNKNGNKEEPSKSEKPKKSKSKKSKAEKQAQNTEHEKSDVQKEPESDESNAAKENTNIQTSASETNVHETEVSNVTNASEFGETTCTSFEIPDDKIDEKAMESLIQAINLADMNLCDLKLIDEEIQGKIELTIQELSEEAKVQLPETNQKIVSDVEVKPTDETSQILETSPIEEISQEVDVKFISEEN